MLHPKYIGYFDRSAAQRHQVVARKLLDVSSIQAKFDKVASFDSDGIAHIGRDRFKLCAEYLCCLDFESSRISAELIVDVATEFDCDIFFPETGSFIEPADILKYFDLRMKLRHRS